MEQQPVCVICFGSLNCCGAATSGIGSLDDGDISAQSGVKAVTNVGRDEETDAVHCTHDECGALLAQAQTVDDGYSGDNQHELLDVLEAELRKNASLLPQHEVKLLCGHTFHVRCLSGWAGRGHPTCPTCRGPVTHALYKQLLAVAVILAESPPAHSLAAAEAVTYIGSIEEGTPPINRPASPVATEATASLILEVPGPHVDVCTVAAAAAMGHALAMAQAQQHEQLTSRNDPVIAQAASASRNSYRRSGQMSPRHQLCAQNLAVLLVCVLLCYAIWLACIASTGHRAGPEKTSQGVPVQG